MFLQSFSEHVLHVVGGGAVVAGLVFGLIGLLIFFDKRGKKKHSKVSDRAVPGRVKGVRGGRGPKKRAR